MIATEAMEEMAGSEARMAALDAWRDPAENPAADDAPLLAIGTSEPGRRRCSSHFG